MKAVFIPSLKNRKEKWGGGSTEFTCHSKNTDAYKKGDARARRIRDRKMYVRMRIHVGIYIVRLGQEELET